MRGSVNEDPGLRTNNFDPLAYIESAFLDSEPTVEEKASGKVKVDQLVDAERVAPKDGFDVTIPSITDYLNPRKVAAEDEGAVTEEADEDGPKTRFRKTVMSAPRPRRTKKAAPKAIPAIDPELQSVWNALPKNVEFLCSFYDDSVTKNYYRGEFKESRQDLVRRLLDPELSLEETSRLLGVCPATVRRYTNREWLAHHRTTGGQRRFRLSDIVKFVEEHGRFPEE